jgi:hypothetical protein
MCAVSVWMWLLVVGMCFVVVSQVQVCVDSWRHRERTGFTIPFRKDSLQDYKDSRFDVIPIDKGGVIDHGIFKSDFFFKLIQKEKVKTKNASTGIRTPTDENKSYL